MFGGLFGKDDLFGTELDLSKYEGMTDEERREAIKADLKAALDKKVADGTLTQAQADKMLEHIDKMPGNRPFAGERKHNAPSGTAPGAADTAEDAGTVTRVPAMGSGSILSL